MAQSLTRSLLLAASLVSTTFIPAAFSQDRFEKVEIEATALKGSVHMLTGMGGNIGVSAGDDGILIIDDQFAPLAEKIAAALGELGSDKPKYVINTHYHGDHTGSNAFFHSHKGATILAHDNVRVRLANDEKVSPDALPAITYENGIKLHFNGETIHIMHFASGHTDGDSIVWFEEPNVVHTGDLYFSGLFPFIDLNSGGSVKGYIESVKQVMAKIDDDTVLIPGHGELSNKAEYTTFLAMIEETFAFVKAQKAKGMNLEAITQAGLDSKWDKWAWSFISEEKWIATLYEEA
ncbi:MBL fold metallo-hydrolase [Alteromonas sp. 1_MG-2023]|uniref:MBL fold metallo-hydrolase n=1 Tax=Alteromonas sp. 1_MG-2023 TaxID=3062669 RepID=UPI0026E4785F|nr:MBL fold metallo-hydrolase [Alteromonas sp. 1_MG-2023]MDO6568239.1 MBL fold metallo-hydrolase [Alteromonas sp. 1_MG-2023]